MRQSPAGRWLASASSGAPNTGASTAIRLPSDDSDPMPVTRTIPFQWYDTPNIHLCTLKDFEILAAKVGLTITARAVLADGKPVNVLPSLRATLAVYRFQTR